MDYKQKVGKFGEILAKEYLIRHGYGIIEANVKISYQEIDLVARLNQCLIFIEVKTRASQTLGRADEAITAVKVDKFKLAVKKYLIHNNLFSHLVRLDFIAIDIDKNKKIAKLKHYKDII